MKAMSTSSSILELNRMAAAAGMFGITDKDKILEFVEAADKVKLALSQFKYDGRLE